MLASQCSYRSGFQCRRTVGEGELHLCLVAMADPTTLFNSGTAGTTRRAIDIHEGEELNAQAFRALMREAVDFNIAQAEAKRK